jgi:hypothetical protein
VREQGRVDADRLLRLVDVGIRLQAVPSTHREGAIDIMVIVQGEADLLEVVDALGASGGLAGRLDGGQQQRDQHGDDRNHDQELDQGECTSSHGLNPPRKGLTTTGRFVTANRMPGVKAERNSGAMPRIAAAIAGESPAAEIRRLVIAIEKICA